MNLKEEYKRLLEIVKKTRKANGETHRNEDIAGILGYTRTYLSDLVGERGVVTDDHIKTLKLNFPFLSDKSTQLADDSGGLDTNQPIIQVVLNLSYIGKKNADSIDTISKGIDKMAATNQRNTEIIAALVGAFLPNSKLAEKLAASLADLHKAGLPVEAFLNHSKDNENQEGQQPGGKKKGAHK